MGNSQARGARKFLDPEPSWSDYYVADWRSERARELDRHGGPSRPPVARGDSITARLVFLEGALRDEQRRMKHMLQVPIEEAQRQKELAARAQQERLPDFILNTDLRAYERQQSADGSADGGGSQSSSSQHRDFSLVAKDPELRHKMMEQRKKMLAYAKGVTKNAVSIKPLNLPAIKSKVASNWKGDEHGGHEEDEEGGDTALWSSLQPAEWRQRVHAARRRTMLVVAAMARWQIALSRRPGPKRLPRVNSFSYYIPQVLGDEARRFIEEATAVAKIKADAAKLEEPPEQPPTNTSSPAAVPAGSGAEDGMSSPAAAAAAMPERLKRGMPRRGVSDSGISASAAAIAVAATGGVASTSGAAGGGGGGGDVGGVQGGNGGGSAVTNGAVRPKRRPELRKSSSARAGKSSSSSPPEALLAGHCSDVESYSAPAVRRLYSSRVGGSMRLPAIGGANGRVSVSGGPAADWGGGPHASRQPRGKLGRAGSLGHGGAARRPSEGGLPPGIAAAAAAGAAVLAAASSGGSAAASRVGSAVAAIVDRRNRGAAVRGRVSDNGLSSHAPPAAAAAGGGGSGGGGRSGSPFMEGLRQSLTGGHPGHRRSEAGALTSAASAPPDSPSSGAGSAGSGFLPRISSSNTVGPPCSGGSSGGGGGAATKPMTVAQARRLALLGEAGNLTGGSDDSGLVGNMAMSPSRLGPLKLGPNGCTNTCGASRSPDKPFPGGLGSPAGSAVGGLSGGGGGSSGGGGGSILDGAVLRHSKEGALPGLRESLAGLAPSSGAGSSPLNSPGLRARGVSLDSGFLLRPLESSAMDMAQQRASSDFANHPNHQPLLGPPPPSGHASPLPPLRLSSSETITTQHHDDDDPARSISPHTQLLSSNPPAPPPGPPPSQPPPLRPSLAATATATAAATAAATTTAGGGLPPLPSGKPPLGPGGERVRSGRSLSSASTGAGAGAASPAPPVVLDGEAAARLAKAQQLMSMYANRVNATWAESQQWTAPAVLSVPEQELFCASDAWVPYKVNMLRMLKAGGLAVHIDACADAVQLPDGTSMDIWTSDPWVLAQKLRPGSLPLSERIEGVSMASRVLQQLVLAVEAMAGREAVPKLTVVLAINDDQRNAVVADIIRTRSYGLKPENLILTAQRKRCGYRYDRDAQAFLEDPSTPAEVLGSGYSLCQLAWLGDAFSVTPEGELVMLMGRTLLERFADRRVEWLVARRARDLALLTAEGVMDLQHLAFAMFAADMHNGNMVLQAAPASALTVPRAYDSTLLTLKTPANGTAAAATSPASPARIVTIAASAAGVKGGGGGAGAVDLRSAELSSPLMVEALAAVRKHAGHDGWVGLQRYLLHIPSLHGMLNTLGIFRPKLTMSGDVARLSLHAADITADKRVACVAVHTRTSPAILTSPNEVDDLIPLLQAQDRSAAFRDIISAANEAASEAAVAAAAAAAGGDGSGTRPGSTGGASGSPATVLATKPGIRILLFVASNDVTQLAVNLVLLMARPGRDVVHLVTVVHNSLQMSGGQALVLKFLKQISNAMIEAHAEVLVKGMNGLLEVMEGAVTKLVPQLVVMASAALTMSNLNTASVMGSVTLSVLKRLTLPVAVATSNSKHLVLTQRRTALRCMVVVDPTSRPTLNFMCSSCMEPMRGDKLVLAGHHPTRQMTTQQQQTQRRLIDNFADIASSHRFHSPYKLQLDGPIDKALSTAAEEETVHLVGLQVPLGTKGVPGHVLGLIRACRGGVLVFRDAF